LPDPEDEESLREVADMLQAVVKAKEPFPEVEETARRLRSKQSLTSRLTVGEWLDIWLGGKKLRRTTINGYRSHVQVHLKPHIGHVRLDRLHVGHLVELFDAIADQNEVILAENKARREQIARCTRGKTGAPKASERERLAEERAKLARMKPFRKITGPATQQLIRSTLRIALNAVIARQLITFNPAQHVELNSGKRPKAQLWTDERVRRWRATGEKPSPVMVWTPKQLGRFLDHAQSARLYAFFHLVAFRGLRRGEGVGQDWADVDLDNGLLTVAMQIVGDGWTPYESEPKTDSSAATIALDKETVRVLRVHKKQQQAERDQRVASGQSWKDTGKAFTCEDGEWLHPEFVSDTFRRLTKEAGVPPINLRDLRHVAATLVHGAGGDLHTIKETLRHSTITLTSDTYTSLLPEVDREVAEGAARLVPRRRNDASGLTSDSQPDPEESDETEDDA
jgi:integrase